jgi:hypothetical protein
MTGRDPQKPGPVSPAALKRERERVERRAQALRANLKRRKHQGAARADASADGPAAGADPNRPTGDEENADMLSDPARSAP